MSQTKNDRQQADVLVVGGGFAGVAAACESARRGLRTILIEPGTYLGCEMTATLRPWMDREIYRDFADLLPWNRALADNTHATNHEEVVFIPDTLKLALEDVLIAAGVKLIYNAKVIGWQQEQTHCVEIAGKFGTSTIEARKVIDATMEGAMINGRPDAVNRYSGQKGQAIRTVEITGANEKILAEQPLNIPDSVANIVGRHKGRWRKGHLFLEIAIAMTFGAEPDWRSKKEIEARYATISLFRWLKKNHPAFKRARLINASHELEIPYLLRAAGNREQPFQQADGIWIASGNADISDSDSRDLKSKPNELIKLGLKIARMAAEDEHGQHVRCAEMSRPLKRRVDTDVLVIGGGTSGAPAAIAAAQTGSRTFMAEMNADLGGVGTVGGVDSYWFGRRCGFTGLIKQWVAEEHRLMGQKWSGKTSQIWNTEVKMFALLNAAVQAGVAISFRTVLINVIMEGSRVVGAEFITPEGLLEVRANIVIDATGDGDAAVQAGADYLYGAERDSITMWFSKAPQIKPGKYKNTFTSTIDVGDADDYTRAILAGRRRFVGYDHSPYISTRETRHIIGEVLMTYTDQLTFRQWQDVVNIAFSNYDIKGHSTSDWVRLGVLAPNQEIEIPYRSLVPRKVDGLLVTGKAISATHDALPAIRMQADLENLGAVCGIAASACCKENVLPRALDVSALQTELVRWNIIPPEMLQRDCQEREMSAQEMKYWISRLDDSHQITEFINMEWDAVHREPIPMVKVCTAGPNIIELLRQELAVPDSPRRLSAAKALAWYGDRRATPVLLSYIEPYLELAELPPMQMKLRYVHIPPDGGAMPELAYLLYSLAMVKDERAIPVVEQAVRKLKPTWEKLIDVKHGLFFYVDSLCHIAEMLADPALIPSLAEMHEDPLFYKHATTELIQPDFMEERRSYLEIVIARALARCGSKDGLLTLAEYLNDSRKTLARHSHLELIRIIGKDLGKTTDDWKQPILQLSELKPTRWKGFSDDR